MDTWFLVGPIFVQFWVCTEQYLIMYIRIFFVLYDLLQTDVNLILTLGLDATDRSVGGGLAALQFISDQTLSKIKKETFYVRDVPYVLCLLVS